MCWRRFGGVALACVTLAAGCLRVGYDVSNRGGPGRTSQDGTAGEPAPPDGAGQGGGGVAGASAQSTAGTYSSGAAGDGAGGSAGDAGASGVSADGGADAALACDLSSCDDGIACTVASCTSATSCAATPDDTLCNAQHCDPQCFGGCGSTPTALAVTCNQDALQRAAGNAACELQLTGASDTVPLCLPCRAQPAAGVELRPLVPVGSGTFTFDVLHTDSAAHSFSVSCGWAPSVANADPAVMGMTALSFDAVGYRSDFSSGPLSNYTSLGGATWQEGPLVMAQTKDCTGVTNYPIDVLTAGAPSWTDATVQARVRVHKSCSGGAYAQAGLALRALTSGCSTGSFVSCMLDEQLNQLLIAGFTRGCSSFRKSVTQLQTDIAIDTDYTMTFTLSGTTASCTLSGGNLPAPVSVSPAATVAVTTAGSVGFVVGATVTQFDDAIVTLP